MNTPLFEVRHPILIFFDIRIPPNPDLLPPLPGVRANKVCKEAGKWETAVSLIRQMEDDGVAPNLVAYNTVIGACAFFGRPSKPWDSKLGAGVPRQQPAHSGHLTEVQREAIRAGDVALTLLDEMVESGLKPDVITFG